MLQPIDMNSQEFKDETLKTVKFAEKVLKQFNWEYNPNHEVVEAIFMGLTRHKVMYGTRYCPCFMVEGNTKEERKAANNRICPCKPAIEVEIPRDGVCHCQIFCTPEKAASLRKGEE